MAAIQSALNGLDAAKDKQTVVPRTAHPQSGC